MANSLLVNVPDKKAHAAISILVKGRILTPYVTEVGAIKYIVKLIAKSLSATKIAPAKMTREGRPGIPALLHRQSVGTNPELHQCPEPGNTHRQLIVRLAADLVGATKPIMIRAQLGPFGWSGPGGHMQALPNSLPALSHPAQQAMAVQSTNPRGNKGRGNAQTSKLPINALSPIGTRQRALSISNVVPEDVKMQATLRQQHWDRFDMACTAQVLNG